MPKKEEMPLRKLANLPYPRLPAPTGPNFEGMSSLYENGSNLTWNTGTERPYKIHFKVIGLLSIWDTKMFVEWVCNWHSIIIIRNIQVGTYIYRFLQEFTII